MSASNSSDSAWFWVSILILVGLVFQKAFEGFDWSWAFRMIGLVVSLVSLALLFILLLVRLILHFSEKKKVALASFEKSVLSITKGNLSTANSIACAKEQLAFLSEQKLAVHFKNLIEHTQETLRERLIHLKKEEAWKAEERRLAAIDEAKEKTRAEAELKEQERIRAEQAKLLEYFIQKKSVEGIPLWALDFLPESIEEAREEYRYAEAERKREETQWKHIKEFVSEHKGFPSDFRKLDDDEQSSYLSAYEQLEAGSLNEPLPEDKELAEKPVLRSADLTPEQRERFVRDYGYEHYPFITLEGKRGNNLLVKNKTNESHYHFCLKHLFAELHPGAEIEWGVEGMRADVAFFIIFEYLCL
ncbi:MAG: hypothetical protein ABIA93_03735 [Candidatus Woesearchaeota archaeon]